MYVISNAVESLACLKLSTFADCRAWQCDLSHRSEASCLRFKPNSRCAGISTGTGCCSRHTVMVPHAANKLRINQQHGSRGYRLTHCRSIHCTLTPYWYNHDPPQNVNAIWVNFDFLSNIGVFNFFPQAAGQIRTHVLFVHWVFL